MKHLEKIAFSVLLLFASHISLAKPSLTVTCAIDSLDFLSNEKSIKSPQEITLTMRASEIGGRSLLFSDSRYEIWVKTYAYTKTDDDLDINSYAITLIDKQGLTMSDATSSSKPLHRDVALTAHRLTPDLQLNARLNVTCHETIPAEHD